MNKLTILVSFFLAASLSAQVDFQRLVPERKVLHYSDIYYVTVDSQGFCQINSSMVFTTNKELNTIYTDSQNHEWINYTGRSKWRFQNTGDSIVVVFRDSSNIDRAFLVNNTSERNDRITVDLDYCTYVALPDVLNTMYFGALNYDQDNIIIGISSIPQGCEMSCKYYQSYIVKLNRINLRITSISRYNMGNPGILEYGNDSFIYLK